MPCTIPAGWTGANGVRPLQDPLLRYDDPVGHREQRPATRTILVRPEIQKSLRINKSTFLR